MSTEEPRVQSVKSAWQQALRAEVYRVGTPEVSRVGIVGIWLSTYANADGSNAMPSRETLGRLAGCTTETVTRALKVLCAVGMLVSKRRPNKSSVHQLVMPIDRPDWSLHIHLYTDTRQRRAHQERKLRDVERLQELRSASMDAIRTASMRGVPDSVHDGVSGQRPWTPSEVPDSVHGRPRTASIDGIRTASMAGGNHVPPVVPTPIDQDQPGLSPQPQVGGGSGGETNRIHLVPALPEEPGDPGAELRAGLRSKPTRHTPWIERRQT